MPIVNCASPDDVQLCYGKYGINDKALFAVCYNTNTLIPEFTGHVLQSGGTVGAPNMIDPPDLYDKRWKSDESLGNTSSGPPSRRGWYSTKFYAVEGPPRGLTLYPFIHHF